MEQNSNNLASSRDTITEKFDDNEAMQRLVQRAVSEAVDKARKLGLLPAPAVQEEATLYQTNQTHSSPQDTSKQ